MSDTTNTEIKDNKETSAEVSDVGSNITESTKSQNTDTSRFSKTPYLKKKKKKKICLLCKKGCIHIGYRDVDLLKNYLKKYNKILSHKISGNCLKHQHQIANSIKRARYVGLLPFVSP